MPILELSVVVLTILGVIAGGWAIVWARTARSASRALCGRLVFVGTLLSLGTIGLVAAFHRSEGLVPMGLLAGALVVGMLWEVPQPLGAAAATLSDSE